LGQYPDGLWGPFIIHDPHYPYADQVDAEFTMTLTDWYHEQMPVLLDAYQSQLNEADNSGDEPTPAAALINASNNFSIKVEPNKTYLIHVICVGNFPGHAFLFDDHPMTVVEIDGVYTQQYYVGNNNVRVATGQRMSVLITTKNDTSKNYAIWDTLDVNMLFFDEGRNPTPTYNGNVTGYLIYNESAPLPPAPEIQEFNFLNDLDWAPYDLEPVLEPVDHQIVINIDSADINGIARFVFNDTTYLQQKVPSLYTALTVGNDSMDPEVYGQVNPFVLKYGDVVEVIVNDYHENLHPFHLHGHQFQVLERTAPNAGYWNGTYGNYSQTPARRDTIMVQNGGYMVMRFRANNPDKLPSTFVRATADILSTGLALPLSHRVARWIWAKWHYGRGP
jgi:iron transport multicopper oxidase